MRNGGDKLRCLNSGHQDVAGGTGTALLSEGRICLLSLQAHAQDMQCVCKRDARKQLVPKQIQGLEWDAHSLIHPEQSHLAPCEK